MWAVSRLKTLVRLEKFLSALWGPQSLVVLSREPSWHEEDMQAIEAELGDQVVRSRTV